MSPPLYLVACWTSCYRWPVWWF